MSEKALQIAEKRREEKGKGEKERYTHLNAEVAHHQGRSQLLESQQNLWVCSTKGRNVWRIRLPAVNFWKMSAIHICLTKKPLDESERGE